MGRSLYMSYSKKFLKTLGFLGSRAFSCFTQQISEFYCPAFYLPGHQTTSRAQARYCRQGARQFYTKRNHYTTMRASAIEFQQLVNSHPDLTATGYGIDVQFYPLGTPQYTNRYTSERALLYQLYPQYLNCCDWFETNPKMNFTRRTTYPYKHEAERWLASKNVSDNYIPQGVFILAALSNGYQISKTFADSPDVKLKK